MGHEILYCLLKHALQQIVKKLSVGFKNYLSFSMGGYILRYIHAEVIVQ